MALQERAQLARRFCEPGVRVLGGADAQQHGGGNGSGPEPRLLEQIGDAVPGALRHQHDVLGVRASVADAHGIDACYVYADGLEGRGRDRGVDEGLGGGLRVLLHELQGERRLGATGVTEWHRRQPEVAVRLRLRARPEQVPRRPALLLALVAAADADARAGAHRRAVAFRAAILWILRLGAGVHLNVVVGSVDHIVHVGEIAEVDVDVRSLRVHLFEKLLSLHADDHRLVRHLFAQARRIVEQRRDLGENVITEAGNLGGKPVEEVRVEQHAGVVPQPPQHILHAVPGVLGDVAVECASVLQLVEDVIEGTVEVFPTALS
mmetsp:Transcript_31974/g.101799  ORF Transcript_31974/g.101799 Transcript_31974/m.101799 type:complete len:321 (-) Transcript_31974:135-1097(-)